jgi:hypothetical protein
VVEGGFEFLVVQTRVTRHLNQDATVRLLRILKGQSLADPRPLTAHGQGGFVHRGTGYIKLSDPIFDSKLTKIGSYFFYRHSEIPLAFNNTIIFILPLTAPHFNSDIH